MCMVACGNVTVQNEHGAKWRYLASTMGLMGIMNLKNALDVRPMEMYGCMAWV